MFNLELRRDAKEGMNEMLLPDRDAITAYSTPRRSDHSICILLQLIHATSHRV